MAFADAFWSGATLTTVWQPPEAAGPLVEIVTVDTFVERAPEGPGSREIFEELMVSSRVLQSGDLAIVWAGYEARFGDPDDIMEWSGIDAISLIRFGGGWRISSIAFAADE